MNITEMHNRAMELVDEAELQRRNGFAEQSNELFLQAFQFEKQAAEVLEEQAEVEPTRSILFRSAASLALDCKLTREAEILISKALAGNPPEPIAEELRDLLEQVNFSRHLSLRGVSLAPDEMQMVITGPAVGFGMTRSDEFVERVKFTEKLIFRTAERKINKQFRHKGRVEKGIQNELELFISIPRAASFAVSFKLGGITDQISMKEIGPSNAVIEDLMECIQLFNDSSDQQLLEKIPDSEYRQNFMALAKQIAPDGKNIKAVGFTVVRDGQEKQVLLTRTRDQVSQPTLGGKSDDVDKRIDIVGRLKFADSTKDDSKKIKLVDSEGKIYTIAVPDAMMSDIVKPLWDETVRIVGIRKGKQVTLVDIEKVSGD